MGTYTKFIGGAIVALIAGLGLVNCGEGGGGSEAESCPGITCTNCSGRGDCNISCPAGKVQYCVAHPDDSSKRCSYCQ